MGTRLVYPPDFTNPPQKWVAAHLAAQRIAKLSPGREAIVQAGGCAGLWPLTLSRHFERVYTCEPEPTNFACLQKNVAASPNIQAFACAVGMAPARVGLTRPKVGAGLWQIDGSGEIPMVTIDDLVGEAVIDAIVLDVEGSELHALRGAERVITTHRPLLWFEYLKNTGEIADFLSTHGYIRPAQGIGADGFSVHTSWIH